MEQPKSKVKAAIKFFQTNQKFEQPIKNRYSAFDPNFEEKQKKFKKLESSNGPSSSSTNTMMPKKKNKINYEPESSRNLKNISPYALVSVEENRIPEPTFVHKNLTPVSVSNKSIEEVTRYTKKKPKTTNSISRDIGFKSDPTKFQLNYRQQIFRPFTYQDKLLEEEKDNFYPQIDPTKVEINSELYNRMSREKFEKLKKSFIKKGHLFDGETGKTDYSTLPTDTPDDMSKETLEMLKKKGYDFTIVK